MTGLQARYLTLAGGAAMNDALLSGTIQFAAGGVPPSQVASLVQVSCGAAPITAALIHEFLQAFPHVDFIQVMSSLFHFDFVSFASNQFV